mmetsp:Transcript_29930/g.74784  ORF Transcript_29930/g.74784 Transcript_29930/m.74784 type:complete len:404 (-) Transcript_29930:228-1439(-)
MRQQVLDRIAVAILRRAHQRCVVLVVQLRHVTPVLDQHVGHLRVALLRGHRQRGAAVRAPRRDGGLHRQQLLHHLQVALPRGKHQRRHAVRRGLVDVCHLLERFGAAHVPLRRGVQVAAVDRRLGHVEVGEAGAHQPAQRGVALDERHVDRTHLVHVGHLGARACLEQAGDAPLVAADGRVEQRRVRVAVRLEGGDLALQQLLHDEGIPFLRRLIEHHAGHIALLLAVVEHRPTRQHVDAARHLEGLARLVLVDHHTPLLRVCARLRHMALHPAPAGLLPAKHRLVLHESVPTAEQHAHQLDERRRCVVRPFRVRAQVHEQPLPLFPLERLVHGEVSCDHELRALHSGHFHHADALERRVDVRQRLGRHRVVLNGEQQQVEGDGVLPRALRLEGRLAYHRRVA